MIPSPQLCRGLFFSYPRHDCIMPKKEDFVEERIREHQEKIGREREKDKPDEGLITHWEREIKVFQEGIRRAKRRLGGKGEDNRTEVASNTP